MEKISGRYLKELREERGYSLRAFADMIYVSKSSVQRWEQSFVPENAVLLQSIANVFHISVDELRKQSAVKYGTDKNPVTLDHALSQAENQATMSVPNRFAGISKTAKHIAVAAAVLCAVCILVILL